jgi:two-component system, NarL family, nitrate/nitrite response regulator NarL
MSAVAVLTVHHEEEGRRAVRAAVAGAPGFHHAGEAASAEEALELALAVRPNLVLIATGMPGIDGRETGERLTAALPDTVVVLLDDSDAQTLTGATLRALWERNGKE